MSVTTSNRSSDGSTSNGFTQAAKEANRRRAMIRVEQPAAPPSPEWKRTGRWWSPALLMLALSVVAIAFVGRWLQYRWNHVVSNRAAIEGHTTNVGARLDGRIAELLVERNHFVRKGDPLLNLESAHLRAELARCEAIVKRTEQAVIAEKEAVRAERVSLTAELSAAQAATKVAEQEIKVRESASQRWSNEKKRFDSITDPYLVIAARSNATRLHQQTRRMQPLVKQGVISQEQWEELTADLTSARANWAEAHSRNLSEKFQIISALSSAEAAINQAKESLNEANLDCREIQARIDQLQAREARISLLEREVDVANADRDVAQANLDATCVRSPSDGWVVDHIVGPGGSVKVGDPIVSLWLSGPVWIEAQIDERDLDRVRVGNAVDVRFPAYPEEIMTGVVEAISVSRTHLASDRANPHPSRSNVIDTGTSIRVSIPQNDERLTLGLSAVIGIRTNDTAVPASSSQIRQVAELK